MWHVTSVPPSPASTWQQVIVKRSTKTRNWSAPSPYTVPRIGLLRLPSCRTAMTAELPNYSDCQELDKNTTNLRQPLCNMIYATTSPTQSRTDITEEMNNVIQTLKTSAWLLIAPAYHPKELPPRPKQWLSMSILYLSQVSLYFFNPRTKYNTLVINHDQQQLFPPGGSFSVALVAE